MCFYLSHQPPQTQLCPAVPGNYYFVMHKIVNIPLQTNSHSSGLSGSLQNETLNKIRKGTQLIVEGT